MAVWLSALPNRFFSWALVLAAQRYISLERATGQNLDLSLPVSRQIIGPLPYSAMSDAKGLSDRLQRSKMGNYVAFVHWL